MSTNDEIVLVTGGSGFIGQHIIKHLIQEKNNLGIREIRSVDLREYINKIDHAECSELTTVFGDICKPETIEQAFIGVDTIFHCAALISLQYPPNYDELERQNVDGTRNIIELCIKYNVKRLIYTSCASVNFIPFKGSTFSVVINQTESKIATPFYDNDKSPIDFDRNFFIPGYSSTKLRAENIVLSSSGILLHNGKDYLQTVALRIPLTYGEGDNHFMPPLFHYLSKNNHNVPRIAGNGGGKQQVVYAGNVAWGHICAYKTLKKSPKNIDGLPAFITDDTPVNDISRFIQRIGIETSTMRFDTSLWYIPHFLFFFIGFIIEMIIKFINPLCNYKLKLKYSLRALSAFTASVLLYNRLRASIHLDYTPLYDEKRSLALSGNWYNKWYHDFVGQPKKAYKNGLK